MKKCIVISDSFKGTLSSLDICGIARRSISKLFPDCEIVDLPVADGGEGTVECFVRALQARPVTVEVSDPYGEAVQAVYCRSGKRAVIEMASAAGLPMVEGRLDPERTTTYGVGQLIAHAVTCGCKEILLGLGGSCTNDGGCGCAAAMGTRFFRADGTEFVPVGGTLGQIARIDTSETKKRLEGVQITVMCDVDNPLHGPNGAAYIFAPQKGADQAMVERLDIGLRRLCEVIGQCLDIRVGDVPGAGAAGGMGAGCIAFLGAEEAYELGVTAILGTDRPAMDFRRYPEPAAVYYQRTLEDALRLIQAVSK